MNEKQQQLTFDKGITNVPSDALCSDNALEESLGMIYDDGEHRVIQKPVVLMTIGNPTGFTSTDERRIFYIHSFNDRKRYIVGFKVANTSQYKMYWTYDGETINELTDMSNTILQVADTTNVTSIGKTLVVAEALRTNYFLWRVDEDDYKALGNIPEPKMEFAITRAFGANRSGFNSQYSAKGDHCITTWRQGQGFGGYQVIDVIEGKQSEYNDLVIGLYAKCKKNIYENKYFCQPFVIRYGLELYDGSFAMLSAPIMMFPAITRNCRSDYFDGSLRMHMTGGLLTFKSTYDYTEWSDIVKDVVVFASDGIELYDTSSDQTPRTAYGNVVSDGIWSSLQGYSTVVEHSQKHFSSTMTYDERFDDFIDSIPINIRGTDEILDELESTSLFYKLFSAGLTGNNVFESSRNYIKSHVIENLTTQERIDVDDYFNHCPISGGVALSYNNRLILSDVSRGFYEGYNGFLPYDNDAEYTYDIYVYVKTPSGTRIVKKTLTTYEKMGIYFYYPDPRAYKAEVFMNDGLVKTMDLKEHPSLHGAYYFGHLPDGTEGEPTTVSGTAPTVNVTPEHLPNEIFVSEVNNPFIFRAEGTLNVGNGRILGVSNLTQALSEGQFGQYPLIIFTTEGIWAASTGATGLFTAVHPMSREVCNNPHSITQTDGAIFFTSAKGLMLIVGSQVKCVSEQMSGREYIFSGESSMGTFSDFLKTCFIGYDYRDSLLWIFNNNNPTCYVYSIKSGTFGRYTFSNAIAYTVNDYPDYLLQQNTTVFSLMLRPDINADTAYNYAARIITRPMKLENALALKSIMQIRHILQFNPYTITETWEDPETHLPMESETTQKGTMTLRIFASNNLDNWVELHSLRGTPWKYYRFRFDFSNMKATDRFAGTMLITQERRTNKLR